jgi:undecaprenyl diphosphate synthase
VPRRILRRIDETLELTRNNTTMTVSMAFNYGGRAELVDAMRRMLEDGVKPDKLNEKTVRRYLYDPTMPDPELMVRTSGEYRISNFLLWQIAYSELVFTDVLWPDFRREHLYDAIAEFQRRERRFGGLQGAG